MSCRWSLCVALSLTSIALAQPNSPEPKLVELKQLYAKRQWVELRQALNDVSGEPLMRGAAAAAFNDARAAETILNPLVKQNRNSDEVREAYNVLAHLYLDTGRYAMFRRTMEAKWAALRDAETEGKDRSTYAAFLALPDQRIVKREPTHIRVSENLWVPCTVNGQKVEFFLDTGAGISAISESEAKRLNLRFITAENEVGSSTGRRMSVRTAVAERLVVGNIHLRDVSFIVLPDENEPWVHLQPGKRGLLGLPVLIGFGTLAWDRAGTLDLGIASRPDKSPNLFFVDDHLAVRITIANQHLSGTLDTGAESTNLYAALLKAVPSLRPGNPGQSTTEVRGVAGAEKFESIRLPSLSVVLGGLETTLRPAEILLSQPGPESCVGNLGLDLLKQAHAFQIDFHRMTLTLR